MPLTALSAIIVEYPTWSSQVLTDWTQDLPTLLNISNCQSVHIKTYKLRKRYFCKKFLHPRIPGFHNLLVPWLNNILFGSSRICRPSRELYKIFQTWKTKRMLRARERHSWVEMDQLMKGINGWFISAHSSRSAALMSLDAVQVFRRLLRPPSLKISVYH